MKKVLVLGATGMLGSTVFLYLRQNKDIVLFGTSTHAPKDPSILRFDAATDSVATILEEIKPDAVINCIGIIKPYCKDDDPDGVLRAITINAQFPHLLARAADTLGIPVITIATDCVYAGTKGNYLEHDPHDALDVYGKSKSLGEVLYAKQLNIRCSVIGPEQRNKLSLLEWFLSQKAGTTVNGFSHHRWNGVTNLQFAQLCEQLVFTDGLLEKVLSVSHIYHFVPNQSLTKYELLNVLNDVFKTGVTINKVDAVGPPVDRTLDTEYDTFSKPKHTTPLALPLQELKEFMEKYSYYDQKFISD
jgi:dTDP-4-dehydrorhamnose reductase